MHRIVCAVSTCTFFMGLVLSAAENEPRGGSAQVPRRSISRSAAPGLVSSASHDDFRATLLQKQVASRDIRATERDLEETFSVGDSTRASSFAESLTDEQRHDHDLNISVVHAEWLMPSETVTAINKRATGDDVLKKEARRKELACDIKTLEPALKNFFATLSPDKRGNLVAVHLLNLLHVKYQIPKPILVQEVINIRQQQGQQRCCVIL